MWVDDSYKASAGFESAFQKALSDRRSYLLLFLLWPFLAFLFAIRDYGTRESKTVVYLFLIYYGLTFIIGGEGLDSFVYAMKLADTASVPFSDFFKVATGLYNTDASLDIVQPLITFIVSRFTTDHKYMFAIFAALFGFFYLKSIDLLHAQFMKNSNHNAMIHLFFFVFIMPIFYINGFRMWTAARVFF